MLIMGFTLFRLPRPYPRPKTAFAPLQLLSILILLAVFAFVARRANGYALEGSSWPAGTIVTFQMGLGSAGRTLIDGNTSWDSAATPALAAWNNVMARLRYTDTVTSPPVSSGDRVNAIVFSDTVFGQRFGSGTLAVTSLRSSGSNIIEADVLFNRNQSFDSYRGPLRFGSNRLAIGDIRRVLIHELGHALGLDHPDDHGQHVDAIMNSMTSNRETLSSDDIAGAQALYGAPTPLAVPEATPTPLYDFNGDGEPDYLLYNVSTRQTAIWYLNNNMFMGGVFAPTLPANWRVVGVADFNRDGEADYLLYNASTRQTAIWYLSGPTLISGAYGPMIASGYTLIGAADFNADGKPDYVLYVPSVQGTTLWYLDNNVFTGSANGPTLPAGWSLTQR